MQDFVPLQDNVALLGWDLPPDRRGRDSVSVTLYWKALAHPVNLRVFIHLMGPDGQLWGQSDKWNPADFPTSALACSTTTSATSTTSSCVPTPRPASTK